MSRAGWGRVAASSAIVLAAGAVGSCQVLFPTFVAPPADAGTNDERGAGDGTMVDSGPFHALGVDGGFATFLLTTAPSYQGGVFDGRYVYMAPNLNGGAPVQRYDTEGAFTDSGAWTTFETSRVGDAGASTFAGALFDGHHVYFIGRGSASTSPPPIFIRYEGTNFESPSSWLSYDPEKTNPAAQGYAGGTFDGRYLYFAPFWTGYVLRYDTRASFEDPTSWTGFDLAKVSSEYGVGFSGAIYDGRYVYLVPNTDFAETGIGCNGLVVRYDGTLPFDSMSAWTSFETTSLDESACGFAGGAFDGRYVYFVPSYNLLGHAARYDTTQSAFNESAAWATFDTAKINSSVGGFVGGAFDGRYVYFIPGFNAVGNPFGILLRYDTTGSFGNMGAWQSYDLTTVNSIAVGFNGAVFDGEYLYFAPATTPLVVRFTARTPRLMPKLSEFFGSFY